MVSWRVAAAQYPIDRVSSWADYESKLERWVSEAATAGAKLAVFPEYGSMELSATDPVTMGSLRGSLETVSALLPRIDALHAELASRFDLHILAASAPREAEDGRYHNAARLFVPHGKVGSQDKLIMTRFEREEWDITGGEGLSVFDTELGRLAILICYDSEFPLLARAAIEAGADIILVPSCTDSIQGFWRVRLGSQARALEGQCYVVHSPTVGTAEWSLAVDENVGAAGIYAPPDGNFPADGVVSLGSMNQAGWVYGEIDTELIKDLRRNGRVLNFAHWSEQPGAMRLPKTNVIDLR